jgi:dCMP deaminase
MINSKWEKRFMRLAREISTWSKDPSSQIGAVIVNEDRHILATGYNGFPKGIADTEDRLNNREEKYPRIVHAETNCLMNALYSGVSVRGATIYVYGLPVCPECAKLIIQSGIKRVVVSPDPYTHTTPWTEKWDLLSKPMFEEVGDISISYANSEKLDSDSYK